MAIANDPRGSEGRNFARWAAAAALFYVAALLAASVWLSGGDITTVGRSAKATAIVAASLIAAAAVVGASYRKRPLSLRRYGNFALQNLLAFGVFLLVIWGVGALSETQRMSASVWVALTAGATIIVIGLMGGMAVTIANTRGELIEDQAAAEELRERGRLMSYSFVWMVACGLLLALLAVAGAPALVPPTVALAVVVVLALILVALFVAVWRLMDELDRTVSNEGGSIACYLTLILGGGWAMLAHLGFTPAPAPLDWITLLIVLMFVASFIALGRRKLLTR